MDRFVMCTRDVQGNAFIAEPGATRYLMVPEGVLPAPSHEVAKADVWMKRLRKASVWGKDVTARPLRYAGILAPDSGFAQPLHPYIRPGHLVRRRGQHALRHHQVTRRPGFGDKSISLHGARAHDESVHALPPCQ